MNALVTTTVVLKASDPFSFFLCGHAIEIAIVSAQGVCANLHYVLQHVHPGSFCLLYLLKNNATRRIQGYIQCYMCGMPFGGPGVIVDMCASWPRENPLKLALASSTDIFVVVMEEF